MANKWLALAGFLMFIVGMLLIVNEGIFLNSLNMECATPTTPYFISLGENVFYQIVMAVMVLGGLAMLVLNLPWSEPAGKSQSFSTGLIVVVIFVIFCLLVSGFILYSNPGGETVIEGAACVVGSPFYCQSPKMNTTGQVSLTIGQSSGTAQYNIELACASESSASGMPTENTINAFEVISSTGMASTNYSILGTNSSLTLVSDRVQTLTGLQCYGNSGGVVGHPIPAYPNCGYAGRLWYNYTNNSGLPNSATNPWRTVQIGSFFVKVT